MSLKRRAMTKIINFIGYSIMAVVAGILGVSAVITLLNTSFYTWGTKGVSIAQKYYQFMDYIDSKPVFERIENIGMWLMIVGVSILILRVLYLRIKKI